MKNKKRISLIVLIITIIVVIILAAAVILTLSNNNSISSANEATFKSDVGSNASGSTTDTVPDDWKNSIASVTSENVPIPKGFTYVTGTKDTGVVIQDSIGNEFVWVPVSDNVPYAKWCTSGISYNDSNISDDTLPSGVSNEATDVQKYGGFYIARYEAGVPNGETSIDGNSSTTSNTTGIPTSKKGKSPWTCIDYTNAKANAESMYSNSQSVKSGLLTGTAWDTTCKWIEKTGKNVTDSTSYGNHYNSTFEYTNSSNQTVTKAISTYVKIPTGSTEYTKVNNIYDLAGNVWEWTAECYPSNVVFRGGICDGLGGKWPVADRSISGSSNTYNGVGLRLRLYIL